MENFIVVKKKSIKSNKEEGLSGLNQEPDFHQQIDNWVYDKVSGNKNDFFSLVSSLPGIYPMEILLSAERLASSKKIDSQIFQEILQNSKKALNPVFFNDENSFNPPHPLDFEWRFTRGTVINLTKYCLALSNIQDIIALLGVPSIYSLVSNNDLQRKFILFDKNPIKQPIIVDYCTSIPCNLCDKATNHQSIAKVVLMDSPWYPEYYRAFFWNASKICKKTGFVLMVTPKEGTRPNINIEWQDILQFAKKNGLEYLGICSDNIKYQTPYFERNALKAADILNFPRDWRCANLAIFQKKEDKTTEQPKNLHMSEWYKISYSGIRVRKKIEFKKNFDPRLISIIPNDILPSVSRRDPRRNLADVWTHGNRIFGCKGTNILILILYAMSIRKSPFSLIEMVMKKKLNTNEKELILTAQKQIDDLVKTERIEQCLQ